MWLTNFQAEHPEVKRKKVRAADATRTKKQNEVTVEKHCSGEYGVLKSIGQIDPETGRIIQRPARHSLGGRDATGAQR